MEDAEARRKTPGDSLTPDEQQRQRELESLQLSRTRVVHDLEGSLHPRHRQSLEAALRYLDEKIKALSVR
jgi:hypothetical protein